MIDTPITEHGFAGLGVGAAFDGLKPIVEFGDLEFRHAGDGSDHQFRRQDALHVGWADAMRHRIPRDLVGAAARVAAQHSQDYSAWYASVLGTRA